MIGLSTFALGFQPVSYVGISIPYRASHFIDRIEAQNGAEMMLVDPPNINAIANPSTDI